MIAYLEGTLFRRYDDRIILLAGGVGYEVLLPDVVRKALAGVVEGDTSSPLHLFIMYYISERQPRPVLIGFNSEIEREFFERFISVEGIGPMAAVKAFTTPIVTIARAIEEKDTALLRSLPGVGARTAEKIIASLKGKLGKFCLLPEGEPGEIIPPPVTHAAIREEVERVLIQQMGYKTLEAHRMVTQALRDKPSIVSAEDLFEEVYRAKREQ